MKLKKLACTLPNQLYFQYFILLLLSSPAGSLPVHIFFFSLLFSHPHTSSHTPQFPLFSVLNFLSSLSFYVVFLFLLLFSPLCAYFSTVQLISASSHLTFLHFSLKFFTLGFLFCFIFFVRYVCLLHFFLLLLFFFFWLRF